MDNLAGQHIKGYELQERIAAGGFGAVYRAYQSTVGREVAVKVILPGLANKPEFIRRFEAEAQLIARLEHMNIVPLYDYWRDPDGAYLVMRYLRGGSLHDHIIKRGALSIEDTLNLFSQVSQGLHVAHRNQVIHRDIKPGNILLDEDGNGYLSDFGIAKDHTTTPSITEPDSFIGSPEYLAPEQARSEPVTPQTDIYSLGVVLYEMLTGEHPFPGLEKIAYIFKHLNDPLPEITTLDDSICDKVNEVIQKATAKDPKQRFTDVIEMMQALRQAARLDVTPTPTSMVELLTPREQEVMQLIIDGKSNREIADILVLTEGTVKQYITSIYRKLRVRSRVQAIARARDLNFVVKKPEVAVSVSAGYLPEPENPYKGLRAFQAADAQDFFGREKLIQKLLSRLQEDVEYRRFLAVVGPSGSGKSSVVKAGLIPSLWRGDLPGSENWYIVDLLPGQRPLDELEIALLRVSGTNHPNLRDQLERDQHGLQRVANLILPHDGSELLIMIDQFEEVFTLIEDEDDRQHFLDLLREAVTDKRSRVRLVVTLRADYYDRPLQYPNFGELIRSRVETVLPLSAEELERAVREPALRAGVQFEDGLVSRIVGDVHYQPGALPLLQYALTELFERRDGRKLTQAAYDEIGGTGGALAKRADEIYLESSTEAQELVRQLFLRLVTLGEGAEDTRRRVARSELLGITADRELMDEIIDLYAASRLLSLDNDPSTRQPTVEVAHEAILREWDRLRQWLNESREDIRQERLIAQAAEAWKVNNRDKSYLLTGTRLEQVETWRELTELALTPLEGEFIAASIAQSQRQQAEEHQRQEHEAWLERRSRNFLRALVVVFALAAILSTGFGVFALNSRDAEAQARRDAETSELQAQTQAAVLLATQSESELEDGFSDRAVLLALEALGYYPYTPQAEHALGQAVSYNRALQHYMHHTGAVTSVDWSPDGTKVATSGTDNTVHIWDATTGEKLLVINLPEGITGNFFDWALTVRWSPDGKSVLTLSGDRFLYGSQDYDMILWDAATGEQIKAIEIPNQTEATYNDLTSGSFEHFITAAAFGPLSGRLATVGGDNTAIIWDTLLETPHLVLIGHENAVNGVAWSPDEMRLATASQDGTARIWDVQTGAELLVLAGHDSEVNQVIWSPDGSQLATASKDGTVRLWNAETGDTIQTIEPFAGRVWSLAWSPDGSYLVTGTDDGRIRVWGVESGRITVELSGHDKFITNLTWSPVDNRLASAGADGIARIWDVVPSTAAVTLPYVGDGFPDWSSDSRYLAISTGDENLRIVVWDVAAGQPAAERIGEKAESFVRGGDYSPNDKLIVGQLTAIPATDNAAATLVVIDADTGEYIRMFTLEEQPRWWAWSPDGTRIAAATILGTLVVWDFQTGARLYTTSCGNWITRVGWSPDGSRLALVCALFGDSPNWPSWGEIRDAATGETLMTISDPDDPTALFWSVAWSPDGTRLLTTGGSDEVGSQTNPTIIWDANSGERLLSMYGHAGQVDMGNWSPDGTRVATGSSDGTTRVWDAATGAELLTLSTPTDWNAYPDWSPNGDFLVVPTLSFNQPQRSIEIWRVWQSTDELIAYAYECCVFRELTPEERQRFGLPER